MSAKLPLLVYLVAGLWVSGMLGSIPLAIATLSVYTLVLTFIIIHEEARDSYKRFTQYLKRDRN